MRKILILCLGLSVLAGGCSGKEDVGDANKKVEPGSIKMPPAPPGAKSGAGAPAVPASTEAKD